MPPSPLSCVIATFAMDLPSLSLLCAQAAGIVPMCPKCPQKPILIPYSSLKIHPLSLFPFILLSLFFFKIHPLSLFLIKIHPLTTTLTALCGGCPIVPVGTHQTGGLYIAFGAAAAVRTPQRDHIGQPFVKRCPAGRIYRNISEYPIIYRIYVIP
jgi:hypothetical protein